MVDAITILEDSADKLQQYSDELLDITKRHFSEVLRKLPQPEERHPVILENLKDAGQKEVRLNLVLNSKQYIGTYSVSN